MPALATDGFAENRLTSFTPDVSAATDLTCLLLISPLSGPTTARDATTFPASIALSFQSERLSFQFVRGFCFAMLQIIACLWYYLFTPVGRQQTSKSHPR